MIQEKDLFHCEQLCREFLKRAKELREHEIAAKGSIVMGYVYEFSPREQGAIKRTSMELTRALVLLRKGK